MNYEELDFSAWLGKKERSEDYISPTPASAMAALYDRRFNASLRRGELPLLWHWFYFWSTSFQKDLGAEGHEKLGSFVPEIPLPRRMYAGGSCRFIEPIVVGSAAVKESSIADIKFKRGSSGPLFFVSIEHRIIQDSRLKSVETQDIVYREAKSAQGSVDGTRLPGPSRGVGSVGFETVNEARFDEQWAREGLIEAESALLFRFSALTYNTHRIHYDSAWATVKEGYPQLVVHGPLVAISLLELLQSEVSWPRVKSFTFRAVAPAFSGERIALKASKLKSSNEVSLEACVGGRTVMTANGQLDMASFR